jgi:hypothetical protein
MVTTPLLRTSPTNGELSFEWAPRLEARQGLMLTQDCLWGLQYQRDAGFRSVYMFDSQAASEIKAQKSSRGFGRFTPWSDCLFIDIDGGEEGLRKALPLIQGLAFELYESGSKGYHIHIPHELIGGNVPEAHRQFVERLGLPADCSLYRAGSIIALPGRVHPKTKRKKKLLMVFEGDRPYIPDPVVQPLEVKELVVEDKDRLRLALQRALTLIEHEPKQGGRHTQLWSLAGMFREAGLSLDATNEILQGVNSSWLQPKEPDEVERAGRQAW